MWFYFAESTLRNYVYAFDADFCLVANGSPMFDHAFILPFKDFREFFSPDLVDANGRWVCTIRSKNNVLRVSYFERFKEKSISEYHNAFHLLQEAPEHSRPTPDINSMI